MSKRKFIQKYSKNCTDPTLLTDIVHLLQKSKSSLHIVNSISTFKIQLNLILNGQNFCQEAELQTFT